MSQEKTVEKSINKKVIALAIICIILAASLIGVIVFYTTSQVQAHSAEIEALQAQIAEKQEMISALTIQIGNLQSQRNEDNTTITQLTAALISAESEYYQLLQVVRLEVSQIKVDQQSVTQDASSYTTIWNNILGNAGYVTVEVTATSSTTYVETLYNSFESNFDYNVTVGQTGLAVVPILPGTVEIRIGNRNPAGTNNNATATVTYFY